ncbi:hypothetical protein C8J56DRAFT_972721 [Mycena floridula]|nr:hypothetical protein C8J56DRAFT_972721 [Mycena floridula]
MQHEDDAKAPKRLKTTQENVDCDVAWTNSEHTLTGMPLDMVLQILQATSPAELLAMHDVNKAFRSMLDCRDKGSSIWIASRESHGIPKPFEDFNEYEWARFIFGRICQACEENEAREPDFGLMLRVCPDCREINLCLEIDCSDASDDYEHDYPIVEFDDSIPHSNWHRSRHELQETGKDEMWWAPDCFDRVPLVRDVRRRVKGAKKKLKEVEQHGLRLHQYSIICDKWRDEVEAEERCIKHKVLIEKFKMLGYQDPELDGLDRHKVLDQFRLPLSEKAWTRLRESLEDSIIDKRRARLFKDHPTIMDARQGLAREAYMAYASTLSPVNVFPSLAGFMAIPKIIEIIEREPDVDITLADFSDLPFIVSESVNRKREVLQERVNRLLPESTADSFNLATTIFRCDEGAHKDLGRPPIFGVDETMRHIGETCDPRINIGLSKVASALVVSVGLDPNTATAADMDRKDVRFRCLDDSYNGCDKKPTLQVFTWRGCITHALEQHQISHYSSYRPDIVKFDIVPPELTPSGQVPFQNDSPKRNSPSWVCGYCTKYIFSPETFQVVAGHVNTVHGKSQGLNSADILLAPGLISVSRSCVFGPDTPPEVFRCIHCGDSRQFHIRGVSDHLKAKHRVKNAIRDVDYALLNVERKTNNLRKRSTTESVA